MVDMPSENQHLYKRLELMIAGGKLQGLPYEAGGQRRVAKLPLFAVSDEDVEFFAGQRVEMESSESIGIARAPENSPINKVPGIKEIMATIYQFFQANRLDVTAVFFDKDSEKIKRPKNFEGQYLFLVRPRELTPANFTKLARDAERISAQANRKT